MINILLIIALILIGYLGLPAAVWVVFGAVALILTKAHTICWIAFAPIAVFMLVKSLRKNIITARIFALMKKVTPKISETEETALRAGTNWIETDLFSGKPDFKKVFAEPYPELSKEEKDFMNNQVEKVCEMSEDWDIFRRRDLSPETWAYMKKEKFFGMIIPKQYGGLGFSALGHSAVVSKLATRSQVLAISTMVPNSLGPAELLMRYGTEDQKNHYLPRLADGRDIPCFALTEPTAGSDAASITSKGEVFKDKDGKIKIKAQFKKRYITLGAIATVIGLAFRLYDKDNLLGKGVEPGITCALLPGDLPGIKRGRRHDPMGVPFINSPIVGEDVVIDLDMVIGGKEGVGRGWLMLMECLAVGRGISLPSTSAGGGRMVSRVVGSYALVRKQFGLSIGKFEAIEEAMARIAGYTYMIEAMRKFVAGAVDRGAKPAVTNAIAKYHSTEKFRTIINDGMDILAGAAVIRGPRNMMAHAYMGVPVGITVEGANIMTRGLIQFGQGAVRCHPYSYNEMKALINDDLAAFDHNFWGHVGHLVRNTFRTTVLCLTRGWAHIPTQTGVVGKYERKLAWASAKYAFVADLALALYGGGIKMKERVNSRFGDILSHMFLAVCALRRYEAEGERKEDKEAMEYAVKYCLYEIQKGFVDLSRNMLDFGFDVEKPSASSFSKFRFSLLVKYFIYPIAQVIKFISLTIMAVNPIGSMPSDKLCHKLASSLMSRNGLRDNLTGEVYIPKDDSEHMARLEKAFELAHDAEELMAKIKAAVKAKKLPKGKPENLVKEALEANIITELEAASLKKSVDIWLDAVQVDSFAIDDYVSYKMEKSII